jgi:hypothetical protein
MVTNEYALQKASIKQELDRRIQEHKASVERRRAMFATTRSFASPSPSLNLLAQGDSWLDYPLPPLSHSDIIAHLKAMPRSPLILSLAHHGEAAEDMLGAQKLHRLIEQLDTGADELPYDGVIFSGGGNDLAGEQFRLWLNDAADVAANPAKGLRQERVDGLLAVVRGAYEDLISACAKVGKKQGRAIPIFAHSYDFALPSGIGVCGAGPWLKPGLDDRGWGASAGGEIVKTLLQQFASTLDDLQARPGDFHHVRTQGVLTANQWANELHPTPGGFAAITAQFVFELRKVFPDRI